MGIRLCFNKGTTDKVIEWVKDNKQGVAHQRLDNGGQPLSGGLQTLSGRVPYQNWARKRAAGQELWPSIQGCNYCQLGA